MFYKSAAIEGIYKNKNKDREKGNELKIIEMVAVEASFGETKRTRSCDLVKREAVLTSFFAHQESFLFFRWT